MQVKFDQIDYFDNMQFDESGCLLSLDNNLFIPFNGINDEDYLSFLRGPGNELDWKMRKPYSSSALCVNFFKYWKENDINGFCRHLFAILFKYEVDKISNCKMNFESAQYFGNSPERQTGYPGYIDLEIKEGKYDTLIHVESKFTEPFVNYNRMRQKITHLRSIMTTEKYKRIFKTYFYCEPAELMDGNGISKYFQLAQRMLFILENGDEFQDEYLSKMVLFLYYEHEDFDKTILQFPTLIKYPYLENFKKLSYQELFKSMKASYLYERHRGWFDYMENRYFQAGEK